MPVITCSPNQLWNLFRKLFLLDFLIIEMTVRNIFGNCAKTNSYQMRNRIDSVRTRTSDLIRLATVGPIFLISRHSFWLQCGVFWIQSLNDINKFKLCPKKFCSVRQIESPSTGTSDFHCFSHVFKQLPRQHVLRRIWSCLSVFPVVRHHLILEATALLKTAPFHAG